MELTANPSRIGFYTVYDDKGPQLVAFWNGLHWFDLSRVSRVTMKVVACVGPLPMLNS